MKATRSVETEVAFMHDGLYTVGATFSTTGCSWSTPSEQASLSLWRQPDLLSIGRLPEAPEVLLIQRQSVLNPASILSCVAGVSFI